MTTHPIFARFYAFLERVVRDVERPHREEVAGGVRGRVLEIGAGTGANVEHYPPEARLVLAEPEPNMLRRLRSRARGRAAVVRASAEALPFRDGAFDTVVASLVLCSVTDPDRAVAEIRRVLAPAGAVRFYEHVRAEDPRLARKQDRYERPWGWFSAGCHPNRDTIATMRRGGFDVDYRSWSMPRGWIAAPHVVGVARLTDGG